MKLREVEVTYIKSQSWQLREAKCKSKISLILNPVLSRGLGAWNLDPCPDFSTGDIKQLNLSEFNRMSTGLKQNSEFKSAL